MIKTPLLVFLAATAAAISAHAQALALINPSTNNGSFETPTTGKVDFTPTTSLNGTVPFWGNTGAAATDTGVDAGADITEDGARGAFEAPGTGIFNLVTSRPIATGDVYTLTFYGRSTANPANVAADPLLASFYTQAVPAAGTAYGYAPISAALGANTETLSNAAAFAQYTLTYTATAADAGKDIGISLTNNGNNYNGLDNFVLNVTPAPEPSTYALMFVGMGGLVVVLRHRRSVA